MQRKFKAALYNCSPCRPFRVLLVEHKECILEQIRAGLGVCAHVCSRMRYEWGQREACVVMENEMYIMADSCGWLKISACKRIVGCQQESDDMGGSEIPTNGVSQ